MKVPAPCAVALTLFHLVSGLPAPGAAPGELDITKYGRDVNGAHVLHPRQGPVVSVSIPPQATDRSSTKATSAASSTSDPPDTSSSSSSTSAPPSSSSETTSAQTSKSSPTNATPTSPSSPPVVHTSTSQTEIESTQQNGVVVTITSQVIISATDTPSATPSPPPQENSGSSGVSSSTVIGLSVAGGLAALGAIAFIAWKLTRKRFSQFDTDDGVINWPDLQKDPDVVPVRPAPTSTSTTNSTVDLVKDPYAVPPLPVNNNRGLGPYNEDPSAFYDPYRGPIPQTFSTPPGSTDGHPQGWVGGEAIPMSTYASGRTSPGPNLAYGGVDPMQRTGTPVQRMATPVQRMATPVGGATFQEIARQGTPGAGPAPYRTGTPGYGYGYGGR